MNEYVQGEESVQLGETLLRQGFFKGTCKEHI